MTDNEFEKKKKKREYLNILWSKEDIRITIAELGHTYTEDDVDEICGSIESNFDATVGTNWEVIQYHIQEHFN